MQVLGPHLYQCPSPYRLLGSDGAPDGFWVHICRRVTPDGMPFTATRGLFAFSFCRQRSA